MAPGLSCSKGVWNLSSPTRDEPESPTLGGGFFTPGPPGESPFPFLSRAVTGIMGQPKI